MADPHLGVAQAQALAVALGQGSGFFHPVNRSHLPGRAVAGQGQGNRTGTGAKVEDLGWRGGLQLEGRLDQQFGIRPRDQGMRRHFQVDLPEALLPEDVGHRLAATPTLQVIGVGLGIFAADDSLGPGVQVAARLADGSSQQQFGIQPLGGRFGQLRVAQQAGDDGHQSPRAASWSAWYSASSGSITASTPPLRMSSSEYKVRLIR
ncbi:hypothetical protein D3C76_540870 [compost metagenome]